MAFDDQLKQAFESLTGHLRAEIDRQVQAAMDELSASARAATDAAAAAAVSSAPTVLNVPSPVAPPVADRGAPAATLLDAIRALDAAPSLTAILDALIAASARNGMGAGVWLLRGDSLTHWRSSGLEHADAE